MAYFEQGHHQAPSRLPQGDKQLYLPPAGGHVAVSGSLKRVPMGTGTLSFICPNGWENSINGYQYAGSSLATHCAMWSAPDFRTQLIASFGSLDKGADLGDVIERQKTDLQAAGFSILSPRAVEVQLEDGSKAVSESYLIKKGTEIFFRYGYIQRSEEGWAAVHFLRSLTPTDTARMQHEACDLVLNMTSYLASMRVEGQKLAT